MTWYCCPNCVSEYQPEIKSVWNDELGIRIGLEEYVIMDNRYTPVQKEGLPLLQCPTHQGDGLARPQDVDARHDELRAFLYNKQGGIETEDTRHAH
jgi:hypothetical protein